MNSKKSFNKHRISPTLYRNQADLKRALEIVTQDLIHAQENKHPVLGSDNEGFCQIDDVVTFLQGVEDFDYINRTHIIELFFKDPERKILINGDDRIKYKTVKYVKPPQTLYLGTIENLKSRIMESGFRSRTKGYVKLYESVERALSFAAKFATDPNDRLVTIAVDADKAFSEGLKFSTYEDGQYIVVQVDKKYLINTEGETRENY